MVDKRTQWAPVLVLVLIGVGPFYQGLFPVNYQLPFQLVTFASLAAFLFWRSDKVKERLNSLDYVVLGLAGLYLASTLWAVNARDALQEGFKQVFYVAAFWMVSRSTRNDRERLMLMRWIGGLTAFLAASSIVLAAGWIPYTEPISFHRLSGPYQYPNALAAQLLLGLGLTGAFRLAATGRAEKVGWSVALYLNMVVFLFTYSRIAWAIALIVAVVFLALAPRGSRRSVVIAIVPPLLGTGLVFLPFDTALKTDAPSLLPLWLAGGAVLTAGVDMGLARLTLNRKTVITLAVLGALVVVGAGGLAASKAAFFAQRLAGYSTSDNSLVMRYWTYKDAARGWATLSPILGFGGGGWRSVYLSYRSIGIISKLTHSSIIETLTELGIQGVVLILALWALAFRLALKAWKQSQSDEVRLMWAGAIAGLAGLLLHSLMDFDLWYPALTLLVYAVFGLFRSAEPTAEPLPKGAPPQVHGRRLAAAALCLLFVALIPLTVSSQAFMVGVRSLKARQQEDARQALERAVWYDPINADQIAAFGYFLTQYGSETGSPEVVKAGGDALRRAVKLAPFNPDYYLVAAKSEAASGALKSAVSLVEQSATLDPLGLDTYQRAVGQLLDIVDQAVAQDKIADAVSYRDVVGRIFDQYATHRKLQPAGVQADWLLPAADPIMELLRARTIALHGQVAEALDISTKYVSSDNPTIRQDALLWASVFAGQLHQDASKYRGELQRANPSLLDDIDGRTQRLNRLLGALPK